MNSRISGLELALREAVAAGLSRGHHHALADVYRSARKEYFRITPLYEITIEGMREHCLEKARGYITRHKGDNV